MMKDICIIGIAGGTASGKTTIVNKLKEMFADDVELISHDCYYKAHDDMPYEERAKLNYDHPSSFDTDRMIEDIKALKRVETLYRPVDVYTRQSLCRPYNVCSYYPIRAFCQTMKYCSAGILPRIFRRKYTAL